jgi:Mg2+/Co2+ transporter CorB
MASEILLSLAAILVILLLSAFFSGAETAMTAASRARLHQLERGGDPRAGRVTRLIARRARLIGALLLGNTVANILGSALATSALIALVGEAGVAYATVAMTVLVVVFAEVLPKTYALLNADRLALALAPAVSFVVAVFGPVTGTVQWVVNGTLRLFGVDPERRTRIVSAVEEIRGTIELHAQEGTVVKHERDMLGGILALAEVNVSEVMRHRRTVEMVDLEEPPAKIVEQVLASSHSRLPVYRGRPEDVVGVLHVKDLFRAMRKTGGVEGLKLETVIQPPWFVPETTTLKEQLDAFLKKRMPFALVVDEYGALMGIVTLEDILEEIVGDIVDEHDVVLPGVRPQPDGSYVIDGTVTIRDLNRQLDWRLPDEEATTIAGLVIHEARVIPDPGQKFTFHGFRFEVLRRNRNQLTSLKVTPPGRAVAAVGG